MQHTGRERRLSRVVQQERPVFGAVFADPCAWKGVGIWCALRGCHRGGAFLAPAVQWTFSSDLAQFFASVGGHTA